MATRTMFHVHPTPTAHYTPEPGSATLVYAKPTEAIEAMNQMNASTRASGSAGFLTFTITPCVEAGCVLCGSTRERLTRWARFDRERAQNRRAYRALVAA